MQVNISSQAQRITQDVSHVLGETFSLKQLIKYIESWRKKPLRIEYDRMPSGMTGYCIALRDVDFICTRVGLDTILEQIFLLHEIAHFLLGHIPLLSKGKKTPSYAVFIQQRNQKHVVYRQRFYQHHENKRERDAELFGTWLFECIHQHDDDMPTIVKNLHG